MSKLRCASCETRVCRNGDSCLNTTEALEQLKASEEALRLHRAASAIEARHYCEATRLAETIMFAQELGVKKIGVAFCVGLAAEAKIVDEVLAQHFEVHSVCCKVGGTFKTELDLERIRPDNQQEVMCHPFGQAQLLNEVGTELNVLLGLCVGHDALFSKQSHAPVTTLIAKDRVLAHNPAGAVYCAYVRRKLPGTPTQ